MGRRENGGDVYLVEGSDFFFFFFLWGGGWGGGVWVELFSPCGHFL